MGLWQMYDAPAMIDGAQVVEVKALDGVKYLLSDDSWLLIRPSGTEPVLRVYAESLTRGMVDALLAYGQSVAAQAKLIDAEITNLRRK